ncbi:MAG: exodeoxyribonuclease III [Patescibacteria group bacterium]
MAKNTIKLISWNVNGLRAAIKKGLWEKVITLNPDVLCIQETKSDALIMASPRVQHPDYSMVYHSCSMKKGYSGVATYSKLGGNELTDSELFQSDIKKDIDVLKSAKIQVSSSQVGVGKPEFDVEGRLTTVKYSDWQGNYCFTLLNGYFPQGGRGPERIAYKIGFYKEVFNLAQQLRSKGEKIIICGDLNTTVGDIDLARPKENRKTTGCLPEEREALNLFLNNGYIDSFRHFYPQKPDKYTYWDQITRARERNVGWRIDYFLVDTNLIPQLENAEILDQVMGSDHCPVTIELSI